MESASWADWFLDSAVNECLRDLSTERETVTRFFTVASECKEQKSQ
jgi:hypothetical protein